MHFVVHPLLQRQVNACHKPDFEVAAIVPVCACILYTLWYRWWDGNSVGWWWGGSVIGVGVIWNGDGMGWVVGWWWSRTWCSGMRWFGWWVVVGQWDGMGWVGCEWWWDGSAGGDAISYISWILPLTPPLNLMWKILKLPDSWSSRSASCRSRHFYSDRSNPCTVTAHCSTLTALDTFTASGD